MNSESRCMYYRTFIESANLDVLIKLKEDIISDKAKTLISISQYLTLSKMIAAKKKILKQQEDKVETIIS